MQGHGIQGKAKSHTFLASFMTKPSLMHLGMKM